MAEQGQNFLRKFKEQRTRNKDGSYKWSLILVPKFGSLKTTKQSESNVSRLLYGIVLVRRKAGWLNILPFFEQETTE